MTEYTSAAWNKRSDKTERDDGAILHAAAPPRRGEGCGRWTNGGEGRGEGCATPTGGLRGSVPS